MALTSASTGADPWPTDHGVVAICGDRAEAVAAAKELALASDGSPARSVTVHTAVEGHTGSWLAVVRATGAADGLVPTLAAVATTGLYATTFRRVKAHDRTWPDGEQTPGVGYMFAIVRHPSITHAEFDAHWRDVHAPLALAHHPGMWDYVQCSFDGALTDGSAPLDGMAICKFATLADMKERFFDGPEGRAVIAADVARFSDVERSPAMRMVERVLA
jgi:uncharacterized protein (TIGR02118 family)